MKFDDLAMVPEKKAGRGTEGDGARTPDRALAIHARKMERANETRPITTISPILRIPDRQQHPATAAFLPRSPIVLP